jgi:NAD+ diphosphatase
MPKMNYCPNCGAPVNDFGRDMHPNCEQCGMTHWRNSKPTAGVLIENDRGELLIVKRAFEPFIGDWDLPGGFLEPGESPVAGAIREVKEELNVDVKLSGLLGVYMDIYGESSYDYTLNFYYMGVITGGTITAADDVSEARWFGAECVPANLAFPHDRNVMADWKKLRACRLDGVSSLTLI